MKELLEVDFTSRSLPEEWTEQAGCYSFEQNALRSGASTILRLPAPGAGWWHKLRVELEVEPMGGAVLTCGDGTFTIAVDLARSSRSIMQGLLVLAENRDSHDSQSGRKTVGFEWDHGIMRADIDGLEVISAKAPQPFIMGGLLDLEFWDDCLIHRIRIYGDNAALEPVHSYPPRRSDDFHLEVTVDFVDDLMYAPWTFEMFDQLFRELKSWGVRRCHWIYYGRSDEGWWDGAVGAAGRNAARTVENVGEIFPAAVKAAHLHGVEIFALFKPFDMGLYPSESEAVVAREKRGKLRRIGGSVKWIADFPAQHRELIMARKPGNLELGSNEAFVRIDLVKEDEESPQFTIDDVQLYVSDDNAAYRLYEGSMSREDIVEDYSIWEHTASGGRPTGKKKAARILRFKDLHITEKYVVLAVAGRARSFANTLVNLLHIFTEKGEERLLTYGVLTRAGFKTSSHASSERMSADFRETGIEFDVVPGIPTAIFPGYDYIRQRHCLDSGDGILAIARGKDDGAIAALSPSFPEVREWWLSWLGECLDAGADGLELRVRNHGSPMAWAEFGFEAPVRDEFLKRHGVDIWLTDDFDKEAWRRLRGEGYTEFYRQAKALAASHGKTFGLHLSPTLNMEPDQGGAMDIHWDWRAWIDEGLADSVTMKEVWPGTRFAEEILSHTRKAGATAIFSPYANALWRRPGGEKVCGDRIALAQKYGCDGFQYYECASVVKGTSDGRIIMEKPLLKNLFQNIFKEKSSSQ